MTRRLPGIRRVVLYLVFLGALAGARPAAAHDQYLAQLLRQARAQKLARTRTWQVLFEALHCVYMRCDAPTQVGYRHQSQLLAAVAILWPTRVALS